ncbi:MAG TPA: deoxyribodipyrimidine photo-lyase [Sphingomonas sp.]|nr:deoxyribodipyrimidine photo-lyase [Sphingomonas sp.]
MRDAPVILWFRQDLRIADQAALRAAANDGPVLPLYVLDDDAPGAWRMGAAQRWWLHHSLQSLSESLDKLGLRLILRRGEAVSVIARLAHQTGAERIHCLRHHEPWWAVAEERLARDFDLQAREGGSLAPVGSIRTGSGDAFRVFAPFWRKLAARMPPPAPCPAPTHVPAPERWPEGDRLEDWGLLPTHPNWAKGFAPCWAPGEAGALDRLSAFESHAAVYRRERDLPSEDATSRLSPHLHFGEVSPATIWHRLANRKAHDFLRELAWRDFAQQTIADHPDLGESNGRAMFDRIRWRSGAQAESDFRAWTRGRTGYPIVDAGMRQLWTTGWMHNRVRMIVASFLVKHLLIDWRRGDCWFWDTLVDADYGNNSLNWQWVAGTGFDASPFFRIMAPLLQSEKFEAIGYIRHWVPELRDVSDGAIHDPHAAGAACAQYPEMIVGHREGRERALEAWRSIRPDQDWPHP